MTYDTDEIDDWPVLQIRTTATPAGQQDAPRLCSVFDRGRFTLQLRTKPAMREYRPHRRIERADGVTRCVLVLASETPEGRAKEAARRAKQILPKPPKTARTMSKGFAALVAA